jgi:hypothetical protein
MPNGRQGDHPLTDILHYGSSNFPDDIDKTVIRLAALPRFEDVRERVADILWKDWPAWENVKPDFAKVREALRQIESDLH